MNESIEELLASGAVVPDRPGSKRLVPAAQSAAVVPVGRLKVTDRVVLGDVLRARKSFTNPDILTKGDIVIVQALTDDGCVYFQNLFRCSPQAGLRLDWFDFVHRPPVRLRADYSHMSAASASSRKSAKTATTAFSQTPR